LPVDRIDLGPFTASIDKEKNIPLPVTVKKRENW
jgi:hypothetical protein